MTLHVITVGEFIKALQVEEERFAYPKTDKHNAYANTINENKQAAQSRIGDE